MATGSLLLSGLDIRIGQLCEIGGATMDDRPNRTVLVTGASGFIGGALVRRLLGAGYNVRANGRSPQAPRPLVDAAQACGGRLKWYDGDLARPHGLAAAFEGADMVVHAAANVDSAAPAAAIEEANVTATRNVCEMALAAGVDRLVYVGTSDVFGLPCPGEIISVDTPYRRWGEAYPDTKIAASTIVAQFRDRGLAASIVHPGWAYGPGDRAFFPKLLEQVRSGIMPDWSPKCGRISLVYIDDLVDGLCLAMESPQTGEFLILDNDSGVSLADICRYIAGRVGCRFHVLRTSYALIHGFARVSRLAVNAGIIRTPLLTTTDAKSFGHDFRFCVGRSRQALGWSPTTSASIGLAAALDDLLPGITPSEPKGSLPALRIAGQRS